MNQDAKGKSASVPDAAIRGNCQYLFEIKTSRDSLREKQLREHLARLGDGPQQRLYALTPDPSPAR